jgi:hypothetical protein
MKFAILLLYPPVMANWLTRGNINPSHGLIISKFEQAAMLDDPLVPRFTEDGNKLLPIRPLRDRPDAIISTAGFAVNVIYSDQIKR